MTTKAEPSTAWKFIGGIGLLVSTTAVVTVWVKAGTAARLEPAWILTGLLCAWGGVAFADFFSGLFHYLADNFGHTKVPVLGPNVIAPFREHHDAPRAMCEHGFVETNGDNALIELPLVVALAYFAPVPSSLLGFGLMMAGASFFAAILGTNQIHKWAHAPETAPRIVRWLQRRNWVLSPEVHDKHHKTLDRSYCITTGWCNRTLDRTDFLDSFVGRIMRVVLPDSWIPEASREPRPATAPVD